MNGDDLTFVQFIRFLKTHNRMSEGVANALQVKGATPLRPMLPGDKLVWLQQQLKRYLPQRGIPMVGGGKP